MKIRRNQALFPAFALLTQLSNAAEPQFGELPPGPISRSDMKDVDAEICRDHLFNPDTARLRLPTGYRLLSAEEAAKANPSITELLRVAPQYRNYVLGSLCFLSVRSFLIDNTAVQPAGSISMAFWWASAEGPRHEKMRGKVEWVQLGSWYPLATQDKAAIAKTDPTAEFVDLDVRRVDPSAWQIRLELRGETITAEVRSYGQRTRSDAPQPGYMSVPLSGDSSNYFSVFTYLGHFHQPAQGTWRATGQGTFGDAFAIPNEYSIFRTIFQNGWTARAGLYRFQP